MKCLGLAAAFAFLAIAACSPRQTPDQSASSSESAASETAAISMAASEVASQTVTGTFDAPAFMGKWTGVKGATLSIVPNGAGYTLTIADKAGSHDYPATVTDGTLTFTRDGASLTLTKGDGTATGEAELKGKHNCLIVAAGEGYCR
jgi:hypothetical protein